MVSVDVVIPVYRPDEKLNRLLAALETQVVRPERMIFVHTGEVLAGEPDYRADVEISCDGSAKDAAKKLDSSHAKSSAEISRPMRILCLIPRDKFDHGASRNLGASLSKAEVMVFMTQDAVPADKYLLERLAQAVGGEMFGDSGGQCKDSRKKETSGEMATACAVSPKTVATASQERDDSGAATVAAAYARQLPCEDCRAIERYIREFNYPEQPAVRTKADIPSRGIKTFYNSNVCAAYRREVFERLGGFAEKTIFNEDMLFGAKAVLAGCSVVYAAEAKVYHSHNLGLSDQFHRNFDNGVSQAEHPEVFAAISSEKEGMKLVRYCISRMKEDKKLYLLPYFVLNCACRYAGFFLGKRCQKLPVWLVKACSLNKSYWNGRKRINDDSE